MTIAVLTFQLGGAGWMIRSPDGKLRIDAEEACLDGKCHPTGDVTVDERGMWFLASLDIDLRWASTETVEFRTATSSWTPADFTVDPKPAKLPAEALVEQVTRWDRGVLPGVWTLGTASCQAGKEAWAYQPILTKAPVSMVAGGKVAEGARTEPCKGGGTGVYPAK